MPMALARAPFCATGRAVCLDIAAIDLPGLGKPAFLGQSRKDASSDAPTAPPVPAIIDGHLEEPSIFGLTAARGV